MIKQAIANRIVPPIVVIGVITSVWYAVASQPKTASVLPQTQQVAAATTDRAATANQQPISTVTPTVRKQSGQIRFTLDTKPFKQIQKVEFYVESKLVGAVFASPFTVSVAENNLSAGTHTVMAKIYTSGATAQTTPALFVAVPTKAPDSSVEDTELATQPIGTGSTQPTTDMQQQPQTPAGPSVPTNLTAEAQADGVSAQLTWTAVSDATSYQVWRDGTLLTTTSDIAYTDSSLASGQTYDYSVAAVNGSGAVSAKSSQVALTMPNNRDDASSQSPSKNQTTLAPANNASNQSSSANT